MEIEGVKVVVIGGGTGSFMLLSGLKEYVRNITALVNMADDGGSTGVLRDELGVLPAGDVRQCLVALSNTPRVRDLFNYRFSDGTFSGHAFGNLFMAALEKMTGNFHEAVDLASEILNITGKVVPMTLDNISLCLDDGETETKGEFEIAHRKFANKQPKLWLEPKAKLNLDAKKALEKADIVVVAPGNLYGSLAPALLVEGVGELLATIKAKVVYVSNLVTKPGQTDGFGVTDFANELERIAGTKFLDTVIYNTSKPSKELLKSYAEEGEFGVEVDESLLRSAHYSTAGANLLGDIFKPTAKKDFIKRTLIRHNPDAVARQVMKLVFA